MFFFPNNAKAKRKTRIENSDALDRLIKSLYNRKSGYLIFPTKPSASHSESTRQICTHNLNIKKKSHKNIREFTEDTEAQKKNAISKLKLKTTTINKSTQS